MKWKIVKIQKVNINLKKYNYAMEMKTQESNVANINHN